MTTPRCLTQLHASLNAASVALARFEHGSASFQIVAQLGRTVLPMRVSFPVGTSRAIAGAAQGRVGVGSPDSTTGPLDRFAASAGLPSSTAIPVSEAGRTYGAVLAFWPTATPVVDDAGEQVAPYEPELLDALIASRSERTRILVCHQEPLVAEGLARRAETDLEADVRIACSLEDALAELESFTPDLIVCSDGLSRQHDVVEVAMRLRKAGTAAPLLVVARSDSPDALAAAQRSGAVGYVPLSGARESLVAAMSELLDGHTVLPQPASIAESLRLTAREREVLDGFNRGLFDKQIARELGIAPSTVKTHARSIFKKLDVNSRTAALYKARELGLI